MWAFTGQRASDEKSNDCGNIVLLKHDSAQSVNIKISLVLISEVSGYL